MCPTLPSCLRIQASLQKRRRDYQGCIATLYRLQNVVPDDDLSVYNAMKEIATLALTDRDGHIAGRSEVARKELEAEGTYYKLLEIKASASEEEIKKAYKRLAAIWHPDKQIQHHRGNGDKENSIETENSDTKFKELQVAYDILSDPQKRSKYDTSILSKSSIHVS